MINIKREDKERCASDPTFLKEILEEELEVTRDHLESSPLEIIPFYQGKAATLKDVITLLTRA